MKKNKKGFTLIELLAVIAIIAIIALIALPTINSLIAETRRKAFVNSAYGILKAGEQYYNKKDLLEDDNSALEFSFPNGVSELELKGEIPQEGTMEINKDGKIALAISNGRYCVTKGYNDSDVEVLDTFGSCDIPRTFSEVSITKHACTEKGKICVQGETLFTIQVNDNKTYDFYVLNDDGTKVSLIMNQNLGTKVAWINKADYNDDANFGENGNNSKGPITAFTYLNSQTLAWTNIPGIKEYNYINNENGTTTKYGYRNLQITNGETILVSQDGKTITTIDNPGRARMLTYEEMASRKEANGGKTPTYLYTNLSSSNTSDKPIGYWMQSGHATVSYYGRRMGYDGKLSGNATQNISISGVRPVIELYK